MGERTLAECMLVASEIGGVMGLVVFMTQDGGISACFPIVTVSYWCSGIDIFERVDNFLGRRVR